MDRVRSISLTVFFILTAMAFLPMITAVNSDYSADREIVPIERDAEEDHADPMSTDAFTENRGQWDEDIIFSAPTSFGHFGACGNGFLLDVQTDEGAGYVLGYEFMGSNDVPPDGMEEQPYKTNYFYGSDPSEWAIGAKSYQSLMYRGIWDQIDLRYFFSGNDLKYEFILHPGADPSDIRIRVEGHNEIIQEGDRMEIILEEDGSSVIDDDLFVFFSDDGTGIEAGFLLTSDNTYGFELGDYDDDREVTIDPLIFSTFIGGNSNEKGKSLDVDEDGNSYITGSTDSSGFPTTTGAYNTTKNSYSDVFVCKMNASGTSLIYSTYIGSSSYDYGEGIVIDTTGNAYVTGRTDEVWNGGNESNSTGVDFPTTTGAYDTTHNGGTDVFILKLNPSGSTLLYSTLVGSNSSDRGNGIDIDTSGNAFVTGYTYSRNFPTTSGAYSTTYAGGQEAYALKLNSTGEKLLFSTFLGGSGSEEAYAIKVDSSGNSYIVGATGSSDFPTTSGAYDTSYNSNWDTFLMKLNSTGKGLVYSSYIGGNSSDYAYDVELDGSGNAFVTGNTYYYYSGGNGSNTTGSNFPVTNGAYDRSHNGNDDCFVFKMNKNGSSLLYSTYLGGNSDDYGRGISVDSNGYAVVTGYTYSSNFPTRWGSYDTSHNGRYDIFVSRLSSSGASLNYSSFVGEYTHDLGYDIHHDSDDYVIVTGETRSSNFPTTNNSYDSSHNGGYDVCLFKLDFTISAPPMAPTNLSGIMYTDYIHLTWEPPADEGTSKLLGYYVYREEEGGGNGSGNRSAWLSNIATIGAVTSWKDYNITLGSHYYYYLVAFSAAGNSPESDWCWVTDDIRPAFLTDGTPSLVYSGETLRFNIGVTDNVKISYVGVRYWYPGSMEENGTLGQSDDLNWTFDVDIDLDAPDRLHYRFHAVDYYGNYRETDPRTIQIVNGRPYFITDTTSDQGSTGESLDFQVQVADDSIVSEVCVEYWYGTGYPQNVTMTEGASDTWSHEIIIENSTLPLNYYFHALDGSGHWNQTGIGQIEIIDNDLPTILLDETASTAYTGEQMIFMVQASDNIELSSVSVEFWFGEGGHDNLTMEEWPEERWRVDIRIPMDDLSDLHYQFRLSDVNLNNANGPEKTVQVVDNVLPEILSDHTAGIGYTGRSFKFSIRASDNIDVGEVRIEYWFEGGTSMNISAEEVSDLYWEEYIQIPHSLDDLSYIVHVMDTSGNLRTSDNESSEVIDKVKPVFGEDQTPESVNTGDDLVFEVQVSDNIGTGMIRVEYWFGAGDHFNVTMEDADSSTLTISIEIDEAYDVFYIFHAMDSSQNWNETPERSVIVNDNELPEFAGDTTPSTGEGGEKFTISTYVDDNIGVDDISVEYWIDDGAHQNVKMTGSEPFRLIIDLPDDGETLYYRFHVTDVNGNSVVSDIKEVEISDKNDQGPGSSGDIAEPDDDTPSWLWILVIVLILLFVLTIVNITVFVMRGNGSRRGTDGQYMEQQSMTPGYAGYQQFPGDSQDIPYPPDQSMETQDPITGHEPESSNSSEIPEEDPLDDEAMESEDDSVQPPEIVSGEAQVEEPPVDPDFTEKEED